MTSLSDLAWLMRMADRHIQAIADQPVAAAASTPGVTIFCSKPQTQEKEKTMPMSDIDRRIAETERTLAEMTRKYNLREQANQRVDTEHQRMVRDCGNRSFLEMSQAYATEHNCSLNAAMRVINRRYPRLYTESKARVFSQYS